MTRKERCTQIRKELKELGITSKQVSVTGRKCGYSDSIDVTIKDLSVNYSLVDKIVKKQESIEYCHASGEILQGCNYYAITSFDYNVVRAETEKKLKLAEKIMSRANEVSEGCGIGLSEKDDLEIVYYPHWFNCSPSHISLLKKPKDWKELKSYALSTIKRYDARGIHSIAEAIVMFEYQYGIVI